MISCVLSCPPAGWNCCPLWILCLVVCARDDELACCPVWPCWDMLSSACHNLALNPHPLRQEGVRPFVCLGTYLLICAEPRDAGVSWPPSSPRTKMPSMHNPNPCPFHSLYHLNQTRDGSLEQKVEHSEHPEEVVNRWELLAGVECIEIVRQAGKQQHNPNMPSERGPPASVYQTSFPLFLLMQDAGSLGREDIITTDRQTEKTTHKNHHSINSARSILFQHTEKL